MKRAFWIIAAIIILPNLLMNALGLVIFTSRAFINLDYFVVAVIVAIFGVKPGRLLLPIIFLLDLVFSISPAWNFNFKSALRSMADVFYLPAAYWIPIALGTVAIVILVSEGLLLLVRSRSKQPSIRARIWTTVSLLAIGGFLVVADAAFQPALVREEGPAPTGIEFNLASSGANDLRIALMAADAGSDGAPILVDSATSELHRLIGEQPDELPSHIVLVLDESWGLPHDTRLGDFVLEPLRDAVRRTAGAHLRYGRVPFQGPTVSGELRELCFRRVLSLHPDVSGFSAACLPALLESKGYTTESVHGFAPAMFSRNIWYPKLRFQRIVFGPDLVRDGVTDRCGFVFPGICDTAAWGWLTHQIHPEGKQFIYWLTLSAHLPLPSHPDWVPDSEPHCPAIAALKGHDAACDLMRVHRQLFQAIASSIDHGLLSDSLLIIVGDHSPPFVQPGLRALFDDQHAPLVEIRVPPARR